MGEHSTPDDLTRRHLLAGLGAGAAIGLTGAASVIGAAPAAAQEPPPAADPRTGRASPVTSTLASAPEAGVSYVFRSWLDFQPESGPATRKYGGSGAYSSGASPFMWATMDVPLGAVIRDVEWYVLNESGASVNMLCRLWVAGIGSVFNTVTDTAVSTGSTTKRVRKIAPSNNNGPHPHGTRLSLGGETGSSGDIQINGVRVGFVPGPNALALLPVPVRVYDSRPGSSPGVGIKQPLAPGEERLVDLRANASRVPGGATAVLVTILLTNAAAGNGNFTMWRNGAAKPQANTLVWGPTGGRAAITAVTTVDQLARCRISASLGTHVVIDVVGFYS